MNDKFLETYLNIINESNDNLIKEEYHRTPLLGWSQNAFSKTIINMIKRAIKNYGAEEFDDYFLSKNLFSFKDLFKSKPVKESFGGGGGKLGITLKYEINAKEDATKILIGDGKNLRNFI